jgi:hypothetical protein
MTGMAKGNPQQLPDQTDQQYLERTIAWEE